ncbi:hypothetical protein K505DRAFT_396145 [Melanomma pulvis-pyrius CBS 109.77]|uniref:Uncharacterized protein n=1 Tax=Melanomma pulvis-pyrius CBS 109.77 TaxID=1314802 RepID=A0A6A6WUZ3_9PLEO|nr:hypothetical protein K505DRAFT_396145 [Melanomma pulvis-pyrius CBS 109.77]
MGNCDDSISFASLNGDLTPAMTKKTLPKANRIGMGASSRPKPADHDSFADLLPIVHAKDFTPRSSILSSKLITNGKTGVYAPAVGPTPLRPVGTNGARNRPAALKMEPAVLNQVTDIDSYMRGYENEGCRLLPSTNMRLLAQDQAYRVQEPKNGQSDIYGISAYNRDIIAPQPHLSSRSYNTGKLCKLESLCSEIMSATDDDENESSPRPARDDTSYDFSNSLSNYVANGVSGDLENAVSHSITDGHLNDVSNGDTLYTAHSHGLISPRSQASFANCVSVSASSPREGSVPIVRLTQDVYDSLSVAIKTSSREKTQFLKDKEISQKEIEQLRQENKNLRLKITNPPTVFKEGLQEMQVIQDLQDQVGNLQREVTRLTSTESEKIRKLYGQIEAYKLQKSTMGATLIQRDRDLSKMETDIQAMQNVLANTRENDKQRDGRIKGFVEEITKRDREIADLKTSLENQMSNQPVSATRVQGFEDTFLQTQKITHEYASGLKELTMLSALKEESLDQIQKIESLMAANDELTSELRKMHKNAPSQDMIDDLKEKLKGKTAEASRLQNDNRIMNRRLELSQATINKVSDNGKALRGAAHLTVPAAQVKLPTTIFGCIECYVKNLNCDSGAKCRNCIDSDSTCSRWRCSLVHVIKHCPLDRPCQLVHGSDGWLITKEPRPQW